MRIPEALNRGDLLGQKTVLEGFLAVRLEYEPNHPGPYRANLFYLVPDESLHENYGASILVNLGRMVDQFEGQVPHLVGGPFRFFGPCVTRGILQLSSDRRFPRELTSVEWMALTRSDYTIELKAESVSWPQKKGSVGDHLRSASIFDGKTSAIRGILKEAPGGILFLQDEAESQHRMVIRDARLRDSLRYKIHLDWRKSGIWTEMNGLLRLTQDATATLVLERVESYTICFGDSAWTVDSLEGF